MSQSDIGHTKGQHHRLSTRKKKLKCSSTTCLEKIAKFQVLVWKKRHPSFEYFNKKKTIPWNFPMAFLSQTKNNKIETITQLRDNGGINCPLVRPAIISWGFTWHWGEPRTLRFPWKPRKDYLSTPLLELKRFTTFVLMEAAVKGGHHRLCAVAWYFFGYLEN